jgi:hypothetical protein
MRNPSPRQAPKAAGRPHPAHWGQAGLEQQLRAAAEAAVAGAHVSALEQERDEERGAWRGDGEGEEAPSHGGVNQSQGATDEWTQDLGGPR